MPYKMITKMEAEAIIRRWQQGQTKNQIAVSMGYDRKTVRKYIGNPCRSAEFAKIAPGVCAKGIPWDLWHRVIIEFLEVPLNDLYVLYFDISAFNATKQCICSIPPLMKSI